MRVDGQRRYGADAWPLRQGGRNGRNGGTPSDTQRRGVQAHEARAERSVEDAQAQHVPAYFRAA